MNCISTSRAIAFVEIAKGAHILDACEALQGLANDADIPAAGFFNGRFLFAEPGGEGRNMLAGFFAEGAFLHPIRSTAEVERSEAMQR